MLLNKVDDRIRESGTALGRADAAGNVDTPRPPSVGKEGLDAVLFACGNEFANVLRVEPSHVQLAIGSRLGKSVLDIGVPVPRDTRDGGAAIRMHTAEVARGHELRLGRLRGSGSRVRPRAAAGEARKKGRGREEIIKERHDRLTDGIQKRVCERPSMR